jgi:hypothetical protein
MLSLIDPRPARDCSGLRRREFLGAGALTLGGLALPELLAAKAQAGSKSGGSYVRDKAVVVLFLQGGPSHIEFFDPKMTAPTEVRSITGEVATKHAGITFAGGFPRLAEMTDRFAIIRSYGSQNAGHEYLDVMGARNPMKATMGAIYARVAGTNHPASGIPRNVLVLPEAVKDGLKLKGNFETGALPTLTAPGEFGPNYDAFNPAGGGSLRKDMEIKVTPERLDDRRNLLGQLDGIQRRLDATRQLDGADKYQQQAFDVILGGVSKAFDLSKEDPRTIDAYDTSKLFEAGDVNRWYDQHRSTNLLGRQMLLARRLVEHGCGFVTVSDCGWDMHANGNSPKHMTNMLPMTRQVDHAVAAFLQDVHDRGLSDKILLVVTGEMGRSPKLNRDGGRDHYGEMTPLLIAGGGLNMGQIIGQSDRQAAKAITEPFTPKHLLGTMMHTLFDVGKMRLDSGVPRSINQFAEQCQPIGALVS